MTVVTKDDIVRTLTALGIKNGDIVITHSSLKSMGYVEGGAGAVIDAFIEAVGEDGTVVFPSLVQKDFGNAYKNWNKDTSPSDVGYITEYFRKLPGTLRSDQATHAAAAQGRLAEEITKDHVAYGPRIGSFGDYAFSYGSPWQKLYELDGKIIFLGVRTRVGTIRHMVEYVLVEKVLKLHPEVLPETRQFGTPLDEYFWPYINVLTFEEEFIKRGLLTSAPCGDAEFLCIKAKDFVDLELKLSVEKPREFISFRTADEEKLARWYSYLTEIDDKMPLWEK